MFKSIVQLSILVNILRLKEICEKNNTSVSAMVQYLGMSKGVVTKWKNGCLPNGETIVKIAEYFNVSADYLLTGKISYNELNKQEQEILCLYRKLPESGKERILGYIDGYLANKKEDE